MRTDRRKHFFINKPFQLRFMAYISLPLLLVTLIIVLGLYIGIWASVLNAFSNERLRSDLLTASRLTEYEQAREGPVEEASASLFLFKKTEKLSRRQKEVFKGILDEANRDILPKFGLVLLLVAWGSIYISHKVAGPLYRFHKILEEIDRGNLRIRAYLRKRDEGKSLISRFNDTLQNLDMTFSKLKNIVRENESNHERLVLRLKEELSKIKTTTDADS